MFGPSAIFNIVYWSRGLRERGWESTTCVDLLPMQAKREDFDVWGEEVAERSRLPQSLKPYALFIWAIRHGDVFMMNFDGGYLRSTPFYWREYLLMRIAGKKLVICPYGGDIAVVGHLGKWHDAWLEDYPHLPEYAELLEKRVRHGAKWADATIRSKQVGFMPEYNVLWMSQLGIDTDHWAGTQTPDRPGGEAIRVVHAPNHRALKRTDALERAVEELRDEGLEIDLRILEGLPNERVREEILAADIVGDQFSGGSYALFAVEGMAAGKPVLSGLSGDPEFVEAERERGCPIVDTDEDTLVDNLRALATDSALRERVGRAGREFVLRHHSYEAIVREWEAVIDFVWWGKPLPDRLRPR
jgi:hypothetical protein